MPSEVRRLVDAEHEAAHVVVALAVGLRVYCVVLTHASASEWGYMYHHPLQSSGARHREAHALCAAAGIAWDRAVKAAPGARQNDAQQLRAIVSGSHGFEAMVTAAAAILAGRTTAHARVTHALLEHDLSAADIDTLCRGE